MTGNRWTTWTARRASALGVSVLVTVGGMVASAAAAPATPAPADLGAARSAVSVTVGVNHTCVVTTHGGLACWGDNALGQLGDGTTTNRKRPVAVVGLSSGVAQVSAGHWTTCAVTTAGGVKCWGWGDDGQLGNGSTGRSPVPVDVVGLTTGVRSVSVGVSSVCAVTVAGAVKCWGDGRYGALGNGQVAASSTPVDVSGFGSGARTVSTGNQSACAVTAAGLACWGWDNDGVLGIGNRGDSATPVRVVGPGADVTSVSGEDISRCATTGRGRLLCWGSNPQGLLGVGSTDVSVGTPQVVPGLRHVSTVRAGDLTTCALTPGHTWCWGSGAYGALGDGTRTDHSSPVEVVGLPGPTRDIATTQSHTCAVTTDGVVSCWGFNYFGELGTGTLESALTPQLVKGFGG